MLNLSYGYEMKKLALTILACALALPSVSWADSEAKVGDWTVNTITDPITDKSRVVASIKGNGGLLAIKCDAAGSGSVYVHLVSDTFLGGTSRDSNRDVTYRFDTSPPVTNRWYHDGSSAIMTDDNKVSAFVQQAVSSTRLAVRARTFRFSEVTALFDLDASSTNEVLKRVYEGCEDTLPL